MEANYTVANGYEHDAKVIYGDTDSVMVRYSPNIYVNSTISNGEVIMSLFCVSLCQVWCEHSGGSNETWPGGSWGSF